MSPMDEDVDIEPNDHALRQVIGVLTPLRQHRQARAERSRQRIEQNLETLREQLLNCQATWSQERDRQQLLRQQLSMLPANSKPSSMACNSPVRA